MACLVFVLALFLLAVDARPNPDVYRDGVDSRIFGGTDATRGNWAWTLSLQKQGLSWSHSCGAVLITTQYALTSCHCVTSTAASNLRILAGLYQQSITTNVQYSNIQSYKMHELYNAGLGTYENDIALLHLATTIRIGGDTGVQQAALAAESSNFDNVAGTIVGWGRRTDGTMPDALQEAAVTILPTATCNSFAGSQTTITNNHICAYDATARAGACSGDGGGPLNAPDASVSGGYVVAGIQSFIISNDCNPTYPSIYVRVGNYIKWIEENISKQED